ncbi:biotin--[acetyl-CoA-carboxylase] ligase [Lactobacillaceae bacterium L1_55_11]|nr:biotin--[acetyl-CoA-carboxylase] ligase [Lactobacillaceae bacterium L1_55_11]
MTVKDQILAALLACQPDWLSGDQLADQVGVSRESVWKAVRALKQAGQEIESRKGLGYRLVGSHQVSAQAVRHWLPAEIHFAVQVFDQLDSTQLQAKKIVSQQVLDQPVAVVARQQTAGYGRHQRPFFAQANQGLYVSLILPNQVLGKLHPGLLTTAAAVAIVNTLQAYFPKDQFQVKWVNDILLNGLKVGGIITEAITELEDNHLSAVILGFFLNLWPIDFPAELAQKAGSILTDSQTSLDVNHLLANLLTNITLVSRDYQDGRYLPVYRQLAQKMIGQMVTIQVGQDQKVGTVTGFNDQGALILKDDHGHEEVIYSGDVTKVHLNNHPNL